MNALLLLAAGLPSVGSLIHIVIVLAIVAIIVWGIFAILRSFPNFKIHPVVWIVLTVLVSIFLIVWLAGLFGYPV